MSGGGSPVAGGGRIVRPRLIISTRHFADLVSRLRVGQLVRGRIGARISTSKHSLHILGENVVAESSVDFSPGDRIYAYVKELGPKVILQLVDERGARRRRTLSDRDISELIIKLGLPKDRVSEAVVRGLLEGMGQVTREEVEAVRRLLYSLGISLDDGGLSLEAVVDSILRDKRAGIPVSPGIVRELAAFRQGLPIGLAGILSRLLASGKAVGEMGGKELMELLAGLENKLVRLALKGTGSVTPAGLHSALSLLGFGLEKQLRRRIEQPGKEPRAGERVAAASGVKSLLLRLIGFLDSWVPESDLDEPGRSKAAKFRSEAGRALDYINGMTLWGEIEGFRDDSWSPVTEWLAWAGENPAVVRLRLFLDRGRESRKIDPDNVRFALALETSNLGKVTAVFDITGGRLSGRIGVRGKEVGELISKNLDSLRRGLTGVGYKVASLSCQVYQDREGEDLSDWVMPEIARTAQKLDVVI